MSTSNINVELFPLRKPDPTKLLRAMAKVTINGVKISGCRLIEAKSNGSLFIAFPQEQSRNEPGKYFDVVQLDSRDDRDELNRIATEAYEALTAGA